VRALPGLGLARAAFVVGGLYALISAYWGTGGTWLLDTVGGAFERGGREGSAALLAVVWLTALLKLAASALGLLAVRRSLAPSRRRLVRRLAWAAAVILTLYGGVLTLAGLLVETGVLSASADADRRALRWHAFLWDPWFLLWGLLLLGALLRSRPRAAAPAAARA
jgi:Protein of unknown function (DUF3995)